MLTRHVVAPSLRHVIKNAHRIMRKQIVYVI